MTALPSRIQFMEGTTLVPGGRYKQSDAYDRATMPDIAVELDAHGGYGFTCPSGRVIRVGAHSVAYTIDSEPSEAQATPHLVAIAFAPHVAVHVGGNRQGLLERWLATECHNIPAQVQPDNSVVIWGADGRARRVRPWAVAFVTFDGAR